MNLNAIAPIGRRGLTLILLLAGGFVHAQSPDDGSPDDGLPAEGQSAEQASSDPDRSEAMRLFESKIRPLLAKYCYECHSAEKGVQKSGLALDSRHSARAGGTRGPAVVPRDPVESWLLRAVAHADELCFIHSMRTDLPNHSQAFLQLHTGSFQFTRPSVGAWTLYGLGTENENLPGFVTLSPPAANGGALNYGNAFLPSVCQATKIGTQQIPGFYAKLLGVDREPGPPLKYLDNDSVTRGRQRNQLDLIGDLNRMKVERDRFHPEIEGAIESFEAGVRFVEITSPVGWDHHFNLKQTLTESCEATDRPVAALLADLKRRGMLEDTLVVWAGEFGRSPFAQSGTGRDHNHLGYTIWMAGGGVKPGYRHGATDEFGHRAVDYECHLHDFHATLLHLLGLDHTRLTYTSGGRPFRLTDVYRDVVEEIVT